MPTRQSIWSRENSIARIFHLSRSQHLCCMYYKYFINLPAYVHKSIIFPESKCNQEPSGQKSYLHLVIFAY